MKFLNLFLKKLVRKKQADSKEEEPQDYLSPQDTEQTFETSPSSPASLELSHEHPLYRLYDMRTEKSRNTPPPEIVMKGCEEKDTNTPTKLSTQNLSCLKEVRGQR